MLGGLGEAMAWKPTEGARKAVDVDSVEVAVAESESVMRVGEAPPPSTLRRLGQGWNLEVVILIKYSITVRMLLDSGASRNIMKADFRRRMQEDPIGKDFITGPYRGEKKVSIAGIHSNEVRSQANDISEIYELSFRFCEGAMPAGPLLTVQFGEMESCADDLLIGCPQLFAWGISTYLDDKTGVPKVYLMKPNVEPKISRWHSNPQLGDTMGPVGAVGRTRSSRGSGVSESPRGKRSNVKG